MPHREWECDLSGMHILTGNADVPHREWECDLSGMHILTENAHSLYRVLIMRYGSLLCFTKFGKIYYSKIAIILLVKVQCSTSK